MDETTPQTYKASDFFIVLIPSRTRKFFINTAFILSGINEDLGKLLLVMTSGAPTFEGSRTACLVQLKDELDSKGIEHGPTVRALCIDDDILIDEPIGRVSEIIRKADELGANIVANYRIPWKGQYIVNAIGIADGNGNPHFATNEQLAALKNFDRLPAGSHSGLGFYYGDVPLDYKYHYDHATEEQIANAKSFSEMPHAEDVNFYYDNKILLSYVDIRLRHEKNLLL
jgi:hypothetical protein